MLFVDLDRFKLVNDSHGHAAGDELLRTLGARATEVVRGSDMVARIGGDEFVLVLEEIQGASAVVQVAERLIAMLSKPVATERGRVRVGASVGVATFPRDGASVEELIRAADEAMYRAKEQGRGRIAFYTRAMAAELAHRLKVETRLADALHEGEVCPGISRSSGPPTVAVSASKRWPAGCDRAVRSRRRAASSRRRSPLGSVRRLTRSCWTPS